MAGSSILIEAMQATIVDIVTVCNFYRAITRKHRIPCLCAGQGKSHLLLFIAKTISLGGSYNRSK
ncbi:MAG: hypothetical protein COB20_15785 [SAR86 cluster bacterium]|uniref:Uncharacterized protein n=1 Tax=SAR86 cluster bacterium TaxID=2030880 RepID=A0A2A4WUE3_9GAMM|nr:MAG: hypothetical protein COB20_15785 [SAR86 cluster bacterium]